jgi:hypothetical protein
MNSCDQVQQFLSRSHPEERLNCNCVVECKIYMDDMELFRYVLPISNSTKATYLSIKFCIVGNTYNLAY